MKKNIVEPINQIHVALDFGRSARLPVGRLAHRSGEIYFEYDSEFLKTKLEISPFNLALGPGLKRGERGLFDGLFGVFNDSLPDGWGRLLFDRLMRQKGINPAHLTPLDRLAHVGVTGLGALTYKPVTYHEATPGPVSLDELADYSQQILTETPISGNAEAVLDELVTLNGSSAGARPKALIGYNSQTQGLIYGVNDLPSSHDYWLVKFANRQDGADAGAIEYVYSLMAKDAGIEMSPTHLFEARDGAGYFAIKRFDRNHHQRVHMHTACGLLHSDFRFPALDYEDLVALTSTLTRDIREVEKLFRVAVFNVLAHNRDDHSKNFSYLMDATGRWCLSPAYDLTFSSGPGGEQSTTVMGEGKAPAREHLLRLANEAGLKPNVGKEIIEQTRASLARWPQLAAEYGVGRENINSVRRVLTRHT